MGRLKNTARLAGKAAKVTGKVTFKAAKLTGKAAILTGKLVRYADKKLTSKPVESATFAIRQHAAQQLETVDTGKGMVAGGRFIGDSANVLSQYRKQRKAYYGHKEFHFHIKKDDRKQYKSQKAVRREKVSDEKLRHRTFVNENKPKLAAARAQYKASGTQADKKAFTAQKRLVKAEKKEFKAFQSNYRKEHRAEKQPVKHWQKTAGLKKEYAAQKQTYKSLRNKRKISFQQEKAKHKAFAQKHKANLAKPEKKLVRKEKKSFKKFKKSNRKANRAEKKLLKNRKRIKKLSKPKLESGSAVIQSVRRQLRNSMMEDGQDNEFIQVGAKLASAKKSVPSRQKKLNKAQSKQKKLKKKAGKTDVKLHARQTNLQRKQQPKKKKPQARKRKKDRPVAGFGARIADSIKKLFHVTPDTLKAIGGKVLISVAPFIAIAFLFTALALPLSFLSSVGGKSSFVMGTYSALDTDLSQAAAYYTKLAYYGNEAMMLCGQPDNWKDGLLYFGTSPETLNSYTEAPDTFTYAGTASWDYDCWKLYSFLCAYYYSYDEEEEAVPYWEYNDDVKDVISDLFHKEYVFEYNYFNGSYWKLRDSYAFSDSGWLHCYPTVVGGGGSVNGLMIFDAAPGDLQDYAVTAEDGKQWVYYNLENLEVLNANDDKSATGWYFQNQCVRTVDPSGQARNGFYSYVPTNYGNGYGFYANTVNGRNFWFPRSRFLRDYDVPAAVAARDALLWRSAFSDAVTDSGQALKQDYQTRIAAYTDGLMFTNSIGWDRDGFYGEIHDLATQYDGYTDFGFCTYCKAYDWVKECKLTYGMKQNMSFDEAIKRTLLALEDGQTLYDYYLLLIGEGDETNICYGNHQTLVSPVRLGLMDMVERGYICNPYGYDMQGWNSHHCALAMHDAIDIVQDEGSPVYAMFDGEITEVKDGYLILIGEKDYKINLWYDEDHTIRATYSNISSIRNKGEIVAAGDLIGYTTGAKKCYTMENSLMGCHYLHICLEINYGKVFSDWKAIDPRLLIALDGH